MGEGEYSPEDPTIAWQHELDGILSKPIPPNVDIKGVISQTNPNTAVQADLEKAFGLQLKIAAAKNGADLEMYDNKPVGERTTFDAAEGAIRYHPTDIMVPAIDISHGYFRPSMNRMIVLRQKDIQPVPLATIWNSKLLWWKIAEEHVMGLAKQTLDPRRYLLDRIQLGEINPRQNKDQLAAFRKALDELEAVIRGELDPNSMQEQQVTIPKKEIPPELAPIVKRLKESGRFPRYVEEMKDDLTEMIEFLRSIKRDVTELENMLKDVQAHL